MTVVAGIDEAGYGPILGPLVVSCAAFRVERPAEDLWDALAEAVTRRPLRSDPRVPVVDSKRLKRSQDIRPLEAAVLAFMRAAGVPCSTLRALLASLGAGGDAEMDAYPWHRGRDVRLPREADDGRIGRAAEALRDAMNRAGVAPAGLRSRPMHVMEFNRTVVEYRNKAMTTALRVMDMLGLLWEAHGDRGVEAAVDKQGGRDRYAAWLASSFWGCRVRVMKESSLASAYEVSAAGRGMKVTFEPRAETRHFCVALASMVSKYVRELFMGMVNDYWLARVPGIRPTAGYVTDGRRFLSDIRAELQSDPALAEMLVRAC